MAPSPNTLFRSRFRTGGVLVPAFLGLAAVGILAWGGSAAFLSSPSSPSPSPSAGSAATAKKLVRRDPAPLTNNELAVALTRFGLAAEPLAAAGCTAQEITALVGEARTYLQSHIQDLRDANRTWGTTRAERDRLQRLVEGGKRENLPAYQAAVTAFNAADAQRLTVIGAIFSAATDGLDGGKLSQIQTIRVNAAAWDVPTQFEAANRSEADWVHLRNALANQRISVAHGEQPDPDEQAFIATQSGGAVATAAGHLADLEALKAAWNAAVFP